MAAKNGKTIIQPGRELSPEAKARQKEAEARKAEKPSIDLTVEDQPGQRRRRIASDGQKGSPEAKKKVSYYQKRKQRERQSAEGAAAVLIMILDSMVGSTFGMDCKMNEHEQPMILEPLERILGRLDYATTQAVERWTDPILLAMGMVAWIGRIYRIQSERRDDDEGRDDEEVAPVKPYDDGTEVPVEKIHGDNDNVASYSGKTVAEILNTGKGIIPA